MPSYYNPSYFYPATYQSPIGYSGINQSMATPVVQPQNIEAIKWVEGEVGAKAFQMPPGWPANQPIPLWDSTDTNIFLKSWSQMGFPNPIQKLHYTIPDNNPVMLPQGQETEGNTSGASRPDMSQFVTKDDLIQMKNEIKAMMSNNNQNGSRNNQNRGDQK